MEAGQLARLKADYRAALAELHLNFMQAWGQWSHERGFLVRNQAHGAPGNLLDLYANADIAETETFGSSIFPIPGLRREVIDIRVDQSTPQPLVFRFAASAAHIVGHPLVSSETCTWLRENWKESLAMVKPEIDQLFIHGINHIIYHGTAYSPKDAAWPGWLFYASTQFNSRNPLWRDVGALNDYVARIQSWLQKGYPDNDILLYWPEHDIWDDPHGLVKLLDVHHADWVLDSPFGRLASKLLALGYSIDYISDKQLLTTHHQDGSFKTAGGTYSLLVIPETRRMPLATLRKIVRLVEDGAIVQFETLPDDVPGLGDLEARRIEFKSLLSKLRKSSTLPTDNVFFSPGRWDPHTEQIALHASGARVEGGVTAGIDLIRRSISGGYVYFLSNLIGGPFDGWMPLGVSAASVKIIDPLTNLGGEAKIRKPDSVTEIYLQLNPGESLLLQVSTQDTEPSIPWPYLSSAGEPHPISGQWDVSFIEGGPELPDAFQTSQLRSWTDFDDPRSEYFSGTASYRIQFTLPLIDADEWILDLGDVRESARVKLNNQTVGTIWSLPSRLRVGRHLHAGKNSLELEVTNLAANRIRHLDQQKRKWKIMREINFVNIRYEPFDASSWPIQLSGILGPVMLHPMKFGKF